MNRENPTTENPQVNPNMTLAEIEAILASHGYYLYREHYPWGTTPTYRTADNRHHLFLERGVLYRPAKYRDLLKQTWCPVSMSDCIRYENLDHDFSDFKDCGGAS